jgi:hypothetical protein
MSSAGETMHQLLMVVLVVAIIVAMTGWIHALGWVGLKLT